jgi:hypothetical protein
MTPFDGNIKLSYYQAMSANKWAAITNYTNRINKKIN